MATMARRTSSTSPTRDCAMGVEEFRGDTIGTVWATSVHAPAPPARMHVGHAPQTAAPAAKGGGVEGHGQDRWARLRTAAFAGKFDAVVKLSSGCTAAELDSPDKAGWTALMYGSRGGHCSLAQLLVERGASVNVSNDKGWTPLMFASWLPQPNERLVRFLIESGADPSARNLAGLSCGDEARSQQNEAIALLLDAQSGANPKTPTPFTAKHGGDGATPPRRTPPRSGAARRSSHGKLRAAPGKPTAMGAEQRQRALEDVPLLKALTVGERRRLARVVEVRSYAAGEAILTQGDEGGAMYILIYGTAEAHVEGIGIVQAYGNRDSFGELALLTSARRGATIMVTSSEAVCAVLHRKQFELLVGKLGSCMSELRRRLRANAYFDGRTDYEKLFQHYDRDNSGVLDWDQFRSAVRRDGQVTTRAVSERQLRILFDMIDLDGDGNLGMKEFVLFVSSSSANSAQAWSPLQAQQVEGGGSTSAESGGRHGGGGSGSDRVNSGTLTQQQRQEKHRRELAVREREQKQRAHEKNEAERQRVHGNGRARERSKERSRERSSSPNSSRENSLWREVVPGASAASTLRSSPPYQPDREVVVGFTESDGSSVSPVVAPRPVPDTPPGPPPPAAYDDEEDSSGGELDAADKFSRSAGAAERSRSPDQVWEPR